MLFIGAFKFIEGFKKYVNISMKKITDEASQRIIDRKFNPQPRTLRDAFYIDLSLDYYMCSIEKPLFSSDIYTEEFQKAMNERNWSPFSNRAEGVKALETLNHLIYKYGLCIDLEKNEFFIGQTDQ